MTCETAVGYIFLCPSAQPRKTAVMQLKRIDGAIAATAVTDKGLLFRYAQKGYASKSISKGNTAPHKAQSTKAVLRTFAAPSVSELASRSAVSFAAAMGRPVTETA